MISVLQRVREREAKERAQQQKRQERTILINHTSVPSGADSGTLHRMLTTEGATVSTNDEDGSTTIHGPFCTRRGSEVDSLITNAGVINVQSRSAAAILGNICNTETATVRVVP